MAAAYRARWHDAPVTAALQWAKPAPGTLRMAAKAACPGPRVLPARPMATPRVPTTEDDGSVQVII